jgi:hypothetical protein
MAVRVKSGASTQRDPHKAVREVYAQIEQTDPSFIVYFAPPRLEPHALQQAWTELLPAQVPLLGGSSVHFDVPFFRMKHNLSTQGPVDGLVAMSLASPDVHAEVESIPDVARGGKEQIALALQRTAAKFDVKIAGDKLDAYFMLLLCDGPSGYANGLLDRKSVV